MYRVMNAVWGAKTVSLIWFGLMVVLLFVGCGAAADINIVEGDSDSIVLVGEKIIYDDVILNPNMQIMWSGQDIVDRVNVWLDQGIVNRADVLSAETMETMDIVEARSIKLVEYFSLPVLSLDGARFWLNWWGGLGGGEQFHESVHMQELDSFCNEVLTYGFIIDFSSRAQIGNTIAYGFVNTETRMRTFI